MSAVYEEDEDAGCWCPQADDARLDDLYVAFARPLLAYALRRCFSRRDAEEVVAETFAVCWRKLNEVPSDDRALLWLYAVARLTISNQRRGERRRAGLLDRLRSQPPAGGKEIDPRMSEALEGAMGSLRADDREILRLSAWEELSPIELAAVLGCSHNAAGIRLHRARRALTVAFHARLDQPS